nr:aminoglycoside phosphotransferase family protein [Streptomyces sp. SID3343]
MTPCRGGADNRVFAARTLDGRHLIVKAALHDGARYGTAHWAATALAQRGIPAPEVVWHDDRFCVETRCPGTPLTGSTDLEDTTGNAPTPAARRAATEAGTLLRRAHDIHVRGYGRLAPTGTGPHRTLHTALHASTQALKAPSGPIPAVRRIVLDNAWRLVDSGARLLVGDCAARHIFVDQRTGAVSGFIDLESARGGDPLADVAGFTVREHPLMTQALLAGYFPHGADTDERWALTIHRARIAASLWAFHTSRNDHAAARRSAISLTADLTAIATQNPTTLPAYTSPESPS